MLNAIKKELESRQEANLSDIPKATLEFVAKEAKTDDEAEEMLRAYQPVKNGQCYCKTQKYVCHSGWDNSDCLLCGGYTY